jgi:GntR family transcriptional regulator
MPLDRDAPRPLFAQLADELRAGIDRGTYPPGARLPAERELIAAYAVARGTVRQALATLADEGLITSVRGRGGGTFVRDHRTVRLSDKRHAATQPEAGPFTAAAKAQGLNGRMVLVSVERVEHGPAEVTGPLGLEEGAAVVRRERHALIEDLAVQLQVSWFPAALVRGTPLARRRFLPGGTYRALAAIGHRPARFTEELAYGPPTSDETAVLGPLEAVARITRVTVEDDDRPLELLHVAANPIRHLFVYEAIPITQGAPHA